MKTISNGFERAIWAHVPNPNGNGVIAYVSETHTWHDDHGISHSFPEGIECGSLSTERESFIGDIVPNGTPVQFVNWPEFAKAMTGACFCPVI